MPNISFRENSITLMDLNAEQEIVVTLVSQSLIIS